jgi:hypothetical protein
MAFLSHSSAEFGSIGGMSFKNIPINETPNPIKYSNPFILCKKSDFFKCYSIDVRLDRIVGSPRYDGVGEYDFYYFAMRVVKSVLTSDSPSIFLKIKNLEMNVEQRTLFTDDRSTMSNIDENDNFAKEQLFLNYKKEHGDRLTDFMCTK